MAGLRLSHQLQLGPWLVDLETGVLTHEDGPSERLEPKVSDLLRLLIEADGGVVSRETFFEALWPGVTVGEDTLTRAVFKLRRALGDDPKEPRFVETVPKRGYRLLQTPTPVGEDAEEAIPLWQRPVAIAAALFVVAAPILLFVWNNGGKSEASASWEVERATDRYMLFTRADNEAAIELYQRALSQPNPDPSAEAGLAAALVQRVIRWPETIGSDQPGTENLESALAAGLTDTDEARAILDRSRALAERSVRRNPDDPDAWRVLGLVRTTQRDFKGAFDAYDEALRRKPDHWGAQINLAELYQMEGDVARSYAVLTSAYASMDEAYEEEPQRVGPWRAPLGVVIAERNLEAGRIDDAEAWYLRVLRDEPFHADATRGLAELLSSMERDSDAKELCRAYEERTGEALACGTS